MKITLILAAACALAMAACAKPSASDSAVASADEAAATADAAAANADAKAALATAQADQAAPVAQAAPAAPANPATASATPNSDTIVYDPGKKQRDQLVWDAAGRDVKCIKNAVETQLSQGVRSRKAILEFAHRCEEGALTVAKESKATADAATDSAASMWIDVVTNDSQP